MTAENSIAFAHRRDLSRYDAIVVILGVNDALRGTSPAAWRSALLTLLSELLDGSPLDTDVLVVGIQPIRSIVAFDTRRGEIADRRARQLNRETERLCSESPRTTFVPLPAVPLTPEDGQRHRTARMYQHWGQYLADALTPLLSSTPRASDRPERGARASEVARQREVDALELPAPARTARLQHILSLAQQAFGADSALITIVDGETQWPLVGTGAEGAVIPRSSSLCDVAIRGDEALVIRDTRLDARFRDNPLVVGGPTLRFYAGFPIESPAGQRLGALCVLDAQPRRQADDLDVDLLRELAHMVQRELWPSGTDQAIRLD